MDERVIIKGRIVSGKGEGAYYMGLQGYRLQFIEKLGIDPYPGTLNVKVGRVSLGALSRMFESKGIPIKGFLHDGKHLGGVVAHMASVSGVKCAVIVPEMSSHRQVAEVISRENLRNRFHASDGEEIEILVTL
jgi:riboflavin kinase